MEVFNFVARLVSAMTDFGALETLRNTYRTLNKRSTSARRTGINLIGFCLTEIGDQK
jgi:hypothetical protein